MTTGLSFANSPNDIRSIRRELDDLRRRVNFRPGQKPTEAAPSIGLGYTPVNQAGDTMTGNLMFNTENRGVIADAQGLKRFGFMKYAGYNGAIVRTASAPFYIGSTNKATVDDVSAGFVFTPEVTIRADGRLHAHQGIVSRWFDSPFAPGEARIDLGQSVTFLTPGSGGHVAVLGNLRATVYEGGSGTGAILRSRFGTHQISLGWTGSSLEFYVDNILVATL